MKLKDNKYFESVYETIGESTKRVNEKLALYKKDGCTVEQLQVQIGMEQLSIQHSILTTLATMIWEPQAPGETLPPLPQKYKLGF